MVTMETKPTHNNLIYFLVDKIKRSLIVTNIEKKYKVIELYNKGLTYREIAKGLRMSLRDTSNIIKEYLSKRDNNKPKKSNVAKVFQLFLNGKCLVEVAIELDILRQKLKKCMMICATKISTHHTRILSRNKTEFSWFS